MKVRFWGVRGSLPAPSTAFQARDKAIKIVEKAQGRVWDSPEAIAQWVDASLPFWLRGTYGVNTPCLQIDCDDNDYYFCDAGTGLRDFAFHYKDTRPATFHFFISHLHWDHIQGFPFFKPAYNRKNKIIFYSYHENIEDAFKTQMSEPFFPLCFDELEAKIEFNILNPEQFLEINKVKVIGLKQQHPGDSYGFRFEVNDKIIVYSTDSEHTKNNEAFVKFFKNADVLIFDGQSLPETTLEKASWGHSSNIVGVELASQAQVKHLVIFHLEPTLSDNQLEKLLIDTQKYKDLYGGHYPKMVSLAYDGLVLEV